ncbi:MAG: filamentous hemagglutinin N-terminal domain-containing protein [Planctomycetes bacterium]|nr:filamentous hemagglutinin N-terminal domain-containing protein [Planctomycetota bacterium]
MMGKLRKMSKTYYLRQIVACLLVYCMILGIPLQVARATVSNPDVVAGSAGISQTGNTTTVSMGSDRAVINWDSLDTTSNEVLEFLKATGNFAVLNRVVQGGLTQFDGSLFGNQGHIIIVNPNGIVFGPTALVQAGKFTASALDIANTDFMSGIYEFSGGGLGKVANYGDISADQVALIGRQVLNAGVIRSPGGFVLLAAGDKVLLGQDGSDVVVEVESVQVPEGYDAAVTGIGDVINEGTVDAAGGKIVLAAGDTFSRAVDGIESLSLAVDGGTGRVGQFGTLNADGVEGDGGSITLIAGDVVALSSDSVTTVNAGTNGDGGEVIAYSPDMALFHEGAQIEAKGGSESGDGGFVEVSGKQYVEVFGEVDAGAANGEAGLFYIDPFNVTIVDNVPPLPVPIIPGVDPSPPSEKTFSPVTVGGSSYVTDDSINLALDGGANVKIDTYSGPVSNPAAGNITMESDAGITNSSGGTRTLTLDAANDIVIDGTIAGTAGNQLNVELNANNPIGGDESPSDPGSVMGDVFVNNTINTAGGSFTSSGINFANSGSGDITTNGGMIDIQNTGNVTIGAAINAGAGNVDIDGGAGVATSIIDGGGTITSSGIINLEASGNIGVSGAEINTASTGTINADSTVAGHIYIDNDGDVTLGDVSTTASDIVINNDGDLTIDFLEAGGSGDVTLTTTLTTTSSGDVSVDDVRALGDSITINSDGVINENGNDSASDLTASTLSLTADEDIGLSSGPIETSATTIDASTVDTGASAADIVLDNDNSSPTTLAASTVGTDSYIVFNQTGGGDLTLTDVSTVDGLIDIEVDGADLTALSVTAGGGYNLWLTTTTSGDVLVDDVTAAGNTIDIDSAEAIEEFDNDPESDLTADTLLLLANTGIYGMSPIETSATDITASTDAGDIDIDNSNGSATTATLSVTTGIGTILLSQAGGGNLDVTSATTADGSIGIDVDGANLTAHLVTAGGGDADDNVLLTTTTSGDVLVDSVTAAGNTITIDSVGAIEEYDKEPESDLIADELDLDAVTGIYGQSPIETEATLIAADTTDGDIDIDNTNASDVVVTSLTTGVGTILFSQAGGGNLDVMSASTADGSIGIDVDAANLTAHMITAGGDDVDDNVLLTTTTSGDVIVDDVKAADNTITIDSEGAISEVSEIDEPDVDLTAATLALTADTGISGQSPIETSATDITASTDAGDIDIDNFIDSATTTSLSVTTGIGTILFSQSGGGSLDVTSATTADGSIGIDVDAADMTAQVVTAGGSDPDDDVFLTTTTSGDIYLGLVTAVDNDVDVVSAGSINDATDDKVVDVVADMLTLSSVDEIGGPAETDENVTIVDTLRGIETTVNGLDAQSSGSGDIVIVETDDVALNDIIATSGSIYLEATNGGMTHVGTTIEAGSSTLTLVQQVDLDLAGFNFLNQANTDLMVQVTEGGFTTVDTANGGKDENSADQWQSIQALAMGNILLQGSDAVEDIKIGTHAGYDPLNRPFGGVVKSSEGGVSIISDNHTVRTAGLNPERILDNVAIAGVSDDELDIGVDLPYGPGKAAIVIMGKESLNLGENTTLTATGTYDTTGDVDDREGVNFLDVRSEIPSGFPRFEGDAFDAAIYLASTDEDVDVSSTVSIMSSVVDGETTITEPEGAMIIDAYDTITFDESGTSGAFEDSLENGNVGDRLEVASRITEWLFQAVGRLPYPSYPYDGVGPFPPGYTYVLRGAGLENTGITDGRAWVLVDPDNAPLDEEAGEQALQQALGLDGCPILIAAVSAELGIPEETIEVSLGNSYALNTDIQPCESCARLLDAALILRDEDGSRMAAMNEVFNTLAPANAPLTPEVMASIVTSFAGHVNDGTQYATAIEYIDAFVQYIAVLNSDIGSPVGDSVAYAIEKYGKDITDSENNNMAAFVATRLEGGEMFGN